MPGRSVNRSLFVMMGFLAARLIMFQFLFKRSGDKASTPAPVPANQAPAAPSLRDSQSAALRALGDDEAAAVAFILQCDFAELRLAAADKVHTRAALEQVHGAMRNVDRRVAKLMQGRLDALRHQDAETARARAIVDDAAALVGASGLTPNQVGELDRRWSVITAPQLATEFDTVRVTLGARLDAQVQLQRAMIDRLGALRKLDAGDLGADDLQLQLTQMNEDHAAALASPERGSLPRNLIAEFEREMTRVQGNMAGREKQQAALAARAAALDAWEATPAATLQAAALRRQWQALPAPATAEQQARFDALLAAAPAPEPEASAVKPEASAARNAGAVAKGADRPFLDALDAMEAALEQGSLLSLIHI